MGFEDILDWIKEKLKAVWEWIKKIVLKIVNFFKNIVSFFKDPNRLKKLQADKDRIAVAIKENLANGNYQVVNCLYDKEKSELVTPEQDAEVITAEQLDAQTISTFGDKEMVVCQ